MAERVRVTSISIHGSAAYRIICRNACRVHRPGYAWHLLDKQGEFGPVQNRGVRRRKKIKLLLRRLDYTMGGRNNCKSPGHNAGIMIGYFSPTLKRALFKISDVLEVKTRVRYGTVCHATIKKKEA